jgi:transposase InsO family protein
MREKYQLSERQARRLVGQPRGTQRYSVVARADEDPLTQSIITLASQYGRYGYRRITSLLRGEGWSVGVDRVQRIWRRVGLKVPKKEKPRGRLWLNDGSCIRLRPERRNHVWSYDFVEAQTHDGRSIRLMPIIDEFTRECLAIRTARRINGIGVIDTMADAMLLHGVPEHIRSNNGPEMTAKIVRNWLAKVGAKRFTSSPAAHWKMDIAKASTGS